MLLSESFGLSLALSFSADVQCLSPRAAWHPPIKEAEVLPALGTPQPSVGIKVTVSGRCDLQSKIGWGGFQGSRALGLSDVGITAPSC